jgi:hypothetical protein
VQRLALLLVGAVLATAALAPQAHAIGFGANLSLPANAAPDCTVLPLPTALGNGWYPAPSGAPTCTWANVGTVNDPQAGSFLAPVAGTVTQVRVRVGPVTGPMQVVVLRAFRDFFSTAAPVCCTEVGRTPVFTPTPNAVTTLATALAVRKDVVPDPVNRTVTFDSLALSVLAPGVPIPAFDTGVHDPGNFNAPSAVVYHPAVAPGQERFLNAGVGGFQVLMDADVTPSQTGAGPAPGGAGQAPAAIALVQRAVSVRDGVAPLLIRCSLTSGRCVGTLLLQSRRGAAAAAAKRRTVTYGRAQLDVAAGKRATVRVKLTKAGRKQLRKHDALRAWTNVSSAGKRLRVARVTLRR